MSSYPQWLVVITSLVFLLPACAQINASSNKDTAQTGTSSPQPTTAKDPQAPCEERYREALNYGAKAAETAVTANNARSWSIVDRYWETAIAYLEAIPEECDNHEMSQTKLAAYTHILQY